MGARPEVVMKHVYFTALIGGAALAAEIAAELAGGSSRRGCAVEQTGPCLSVLLSSERGEIVD